MEDFAVEIRYPDTVIELSDEDIRQAFLIAKMIREFVLNQMELSIEYKDVEKK